MRDAGIWGRAIRWLSHYKGKRRKLQALPRRCPHFDFQNVLDGDGCPIFEDDPSLQRVDSFDRPLGGNVGPAVLPLVRQELGEYTCPACFQQQAEFFIQKGFFVLRQLNPLVGESGRFLDSGPMTYQRRLSEKINVVTPYQLKSRISLDNSGESAYDNNALF